MRVGGQSLRPLWWLFGAALGLRLLLAIPLSTNGDIEHLALVGGWLRDDPLSIYVVQHGDVWPYPPGYFPVIALADALHSATGIAFATLIRLPVIAANLAIAWMINSELERRALDPKWRLAAVSTVLFGPLLLFESGWHGQVDLVALAFAVAGFLAWDRLSGDRRAVAAGLLLATAGLIKIVPGLAILALIPHARNRRELLLLLGSAAALVAVVLAPWALEDSGALLEKLRYQGLAGVAGLSVLVQPTSAELWLNGVPLNPSSVQTQLQDHAQLLTLLALGAAFAVLLVKRISPAAGAVLIFLAIYVSSANVALHYLLWMVPFMLLAGWVRLAVAFQIATIIPVVLVYWPAIDHTLASTQSPWPKALTDYLYVPYMDLLWLAGVIALLTIVVRGPRGHASPVIPERATPGSTAS